MDLYRVGMPEDDDIIVRDKFIIDIIIPLCIKKISEEQYSILYFAEQESTESSIFLQSIIKFDENDEGFLNNHPLNVINIQRNPDRLAFYNEKIKHINGNMFNTDFDMEEYEENRRYFYAKGIKALNLKDGVTKAALMDLLITRDNFIKINLFMTNFLKLDYSAESIFINKKIKNVQFLTVNSVKLNGSAANRLTGIVYSSYYIGRGPTQYRMNFISPYKEGKLVNPMLPNTFAALYQEDFLIKNIIFDGHKDRIYILYEIRSSLNNAYMETIVLVMDKDQYDHTNFVDLYKIYED